MKLQDKRIFIVEDNAENIYVISSLLRKHSAHVIIDWWASGRPTQLLNSLPLDLIILDLMLPNGRSGYDIFDELRALPELAQVPIIAVSATDPSIGLPETQAKGFSGFISKPVDFHLFPDQIAAIINGEAVWYAD